MPPSRLPFLDLLRGFAMLGILTMNITLGLPGASRLNPEIAGGFSGANFWLWLTGYLLFDEKMITLFSYLFGAGICLAAGSVSHSLGGTIRRQLALLVIGLCHAYFIWEGDILTFYGICGLLVYPLRHLPPRRLFLLAVLLWIPSVVLSQVFASFIAAGANSSDPEMAQFATAFRPSPQEVARMIAEMRRTGWWQLVVKRAPETLGFHLMVFPISFLWTICARMILGMALLKTGFLLATGDPRLHIRRALLFYGLGYPLVGFACWGLLRHHFEASYLFSVGLNVNQIGSAFVALGHASSLFYLWQKGWLSWLASALTAVGRLSLSNYLFQSTAMTTLFYGYGFGWFGQLDRKGLALVVLLTWLVELLGSWLWLRAFAIGPAEWLWRWLATGQRLAWRH